MLQFQNIMENLKKGLGEHLVNNTQIVCASSLSEIPLKSIAGIYSKTWAESGIVIDPETAYTKIARFNPDNIFLLMDSERKKTYATLLTALVEASSITDLVLQLPTYKSVEKLSEESLPHAPNFLVCFSLNCSNGYRVVDSLNRELSLARAILTGVPVPHGVRKLGYSFIPNVPLQTSLADHYLGCLHDTRKLGPVGMHEALGGITVATIANSRSEHTNAGGGNVLVLYPIDNEEAQVFAEVKRKRSEGPSQVTTVTENNVTYFCDIK